MRVARGLPPARQVELLRDLRPLLDQLESEPVYAKVAGSRSQTQTGIAKSTLGHVCQFLARYPERSTLEGFLSRLEALDKATSQNQDNPSGQHAALQGVLQKFLKSHPRYDGEDLLFLFSWARRFLKDEERRLEGRAVLPLPQPSKSPSQPLTAMQLALAKAQHVPGQSGKKGKPDEE